MLKSGLLILKSMEFYHKCMTFLFVYINGKKVANLSQVENTIFRLKWAFFRPTGKVGEQRTRGSVFDPHKKRGGVFVQGVLFKRTK